MTHGTKQKIMDAALKEFSEKGYSGAKTKDIAIKSGLSEMTLFRRFKSKKNLFNQVLNKNEEDVIKDFNITLVNIKDIGDSKDYFKNLTNQLWILTGKYFEFLNIIILERHELSEDIIADLVSYLTDALEKIFPNSNFDPRIYAFSILSFMYLSVLDKRLGRNIIDHEEDFSKFIDFSMKCL
jgi:AcrR family transcriptional regulator